MPYEVSPSSLVSMPIRPVSATSGAPDEPTRTGRLSICSFDSNVIAAMRPGSTGVNQSLSRPMNHTAIPRSFPGCPTLPRTSAFQENPCGLATRRTARSRTVLELSRSSAVVAAPSPDSHTLRDVDLPRSSRTTWFAVAM